uniref:Synaptobrevin, longin-like domain protein n=1 Tax=Tanacetum cinerariifolium TaxID=118510 RepID=A0A699GPF2_TANCI|nr:hypothetical protein [Tanacetum cinerariifolium]
MVAYLTKSDASEGFNKIINFMNGSSIKYGLTVNPHIYMSCIKQFWTTVAVKKVNDVIRLQALVDKKKVMVTEATIRDALRLDDADGVECLPNKEIYAELARMGYEKPSTKLTFYKAFFSSQWKFLIYTILQCMSAKRTSWNEFSSSIASAVICVSLGRKFNFSKFIFDSLVRNVDSPSKFYMYLHFLQLMIRKQVGKGFSRVETPLFEGMLVEQQVVEEGDADENDENVNAGDTAEGDVSAAHDEVPTVQPTPPQSPQVQPQSPQPQQDAGIPMNLSKKLKQRVKKLERRNKVKVLKLRRLRKVRTTQRVETFDETVMDDVSNQERMIADMDQDVDVVLEDDKEEDESEPAKVHEVVDVFTTAKIVPEVVTAASETITAASTTITAAEAQVPTATLTAAPIRVTAAPSRRRRKEVVIRDPQEESTTSTIIPDKTKSKDKGKGIFVKEPKPLKKQQQIKQDEKYARELEVELNKNIDWDEVVDHVKNKNVAGFKMDYFKGMSYDDIRPIFEAKFNSNVAFLLKTKEQIEVEESRALKRLNETPAEKVAKRQKLDEEVEELKKHLQIVPNEDDDVYTEATPLSRKVPVVDYEIIKQNNKTYYKIIRDDDTHQMYVSFLSLPRNFDREDLEALWNLVKERFSITKPKNFFNAFLLITLGAMFEKPDIHAQIWKNQRSVHGPAKVKGWKLLESCGVYNHIADFVSREEVPTHKIHSGSDAECSLELMLPRNSRKTCKCLMLLVKDLVLSSQDNDVD